MSLHERKPIYERATANRSVEVRTGASQSKTKISDKLKAYVNHHRHVAKESLQRLLKTPLQSLLTWLVVAIAIALPGMLYIALNQFQSLGENWQAKPQLSVFVHYRAREAAILSLRDKLQTRPDIETVDYISPEKALIEFEQFSGLGNVLQTLDENPLPAVLVVQPTEVSSHPEQMETLREVLTQEQLIDDVRIDMEWVRRLNQLMTIGQRIVMALAGLLSLGVLLVIGNTIRLAIESRREEIVIVKLVGGTNAFVRRPFLYTGFWYGLGGGVLACILLAVGVYWLSGPIEELASLYQSEGGLNGLSFLETLVILIGAGILGLLGALLAVSKHLHTIEPR
ncbi:MAG: permease-like cell division protein FtsX [Cellvibrionaceae bacterium]